MLDALGFRGIWRRVGLDELRSSLNQLTATVRRDVEDLVQRIGGTKPVIETRFLSDTVVFTVAHDLPFTSGPPTGIRDAGEKAAAIAPFSVEVAAAFASLFQARAVSAPVPLAFRGAIGFGDYVLDGNFLIGPAIDEVAEEHQAPNGAFVWLLPSAAAVLDLYQAQDRKQQLLERVLIRGIRIPVKRGWARRGLVVNPLAAPGVPNETEQRLLATFGEPRVLSGVWWKRRATEQLLNAARAHNVRVSAPGRAREWAR